MATSKLEFIVEETTTTSDVPTMSMEQFAALIAESLAPTPKRKPKPRVHSHLKR